MSKITSTRTIPTTVEKVFEVAKQVERFPEVLPNLDHVNIRENDGQGNMVTEWKASFQVGPLTKSVSWTERDFWNAGDYTCRFDLVDGDMKTYEGSWTFKPNGDNCDVELVVDFDLGLSLLGPMINNIVDQLMQQNCDELLEALEKLSTS